MKKYTIKDSLGNKKTVYAEDVTHAIKLVDMGQHAPATAVPAHQTYNPEYSIQQFKSYIHNIIKDLYGNDYNRETVRAISKLNTYASQVIDDFKADIKNSDLDKRKTVQYYTQYVDALYEEITDVANVRNIDGQSLKKVDDIHAKMARSIHDSVHDEASLATSINALVTDEKAAIDAYNVAINNLKGKIDDNAMQVLINIMKDERKHVENLYAILNGQVTEKNLEDSIKDAAPGVDKKKFDRLVSYFNAWGKPSRNELQEVIDYYRLNSATAYQLLYYWGYKNEFEKLHFYDSRTRDSLNEAKNLVESAGFKVLRAYGSDNEPCITVRWDGSYSELNRKVRALKSEARKIGYKDVYTDDNDICFSRY